MGRSRPPGAAREGARRAPRDPWAGRKLRPGERVPVDFEMPVPCVLAEARDRVPTSLRKMELVVACAHLSLATCASPHTTRSEW
mgnify:CR=1 FL=1